MKDDVVARFPVERAEKGEERRSKDPSMEGIKMAIKTVHSRPVSARCYL